MATDDSGKGQDPTDNASWTDEGGVRWHRRSAIYGKRLHKLLASADVRVVHWSNEGGETRDVAVVDRELLRHAVDRTLSDSDIRYERSLYAYEFKGPNHETLVIISEHRNDLPE